MKNKERAEKNLERWIVQTGRPISTQETLGVSELTPAQTVRHLQKLAKRGELTKREDDEIMDFYWEATAKLRRRAATESEAELAEE